MTMRPAVLILSGLVGVAGVLGILTLYLAPIATTGATATDSGGEVVSNTGSLIWLINRDGVGVLLALTLVFGLLTVAVVASGIGYAMTGARIERITLLIASLLLLLGAMVVTPHATPVLQPAGWLALLTLIVAYLPGAAPAGA